MGTTCSCVEPCEKKPSCLSNLKYKLQYSAENRRQNRQCPCTNRRPKCLRRRRKRRNPFCDCEETGLPHQTSQISQFQDCGCPLHPNPAVQTTPPQQKTILRTRSRSQSPAAPQINVFPYPQQSQNIRSASSGYQARPSTPSTKDAGTYTNIEETPPSEPTTPRPNRCPRSKPPTPVCPRKTVCTCTNKEEIPPPDQFLRSKSKNSSPMFSRKPYTTTAETETAPYEPPTYMQKTCLRSKQHLPVCPRRMAMTTKTAGIQAQRQDRPVMRTRSPEESRSPSPNCNKETCPFLVKKGQERKPVGFLRRSPSPETVKKVCICANSLQEDSNDNFTENLKNVRKFTIEAYFV